MPSHLVLLCIIIAFLHDSQSSAAEEKGGKAVLRSAMAEMICMQRDLEHNFTTPPKPHKSRLYDLFADECKYIRWKDCDTPNCHKFHVEERKNCKSTRNDSIFLDDTYERENPKTSRGGLHDDRYLWPPTQPGERHIPYVITGPWKDGPYGQIIKRAMRAIEYCTCIRFVERTTETDYIDILRDGYTCRSDVGRKGGRQNISLYSASVCYQGAVIHELLHAIAFVHEQARSDRDDWVTVNLDKVPQRAHRNFNKLDPRDWESFGIRYDYNSILHYARNLGSTDGSEVLTPIKQADAVLGQTQFLSLLDAVQVMFMYNCLRIPLHANCPIFGIGRRGDWYPTRRENLKK